MHNDEIIEQVLIEQGGFSDKKKPVILTSGKIGIYYVNTEKIVQDGGKFNRYGDDSVAMIKHARHMAEQQATFSNVIDILVGKVELLIPATSMDCAAVSGGQRRDWLFSGPVAARLGLPHISLYKQDPGYDDCVEMVMPDLSVESNHNLEGMYSVHVVDLITKGSSGYRKEKGVDKGWVPMLRSRGAHINDLVAVVSRLEGGEELMESVDVNTHSFVKIDCDFLTRCSRYHVRATKYRDDSDAWGENYIREHGAVGFAAYFNPDGNDLPRARRFMKHYSAVLEESGKLRELKDVVQKMYLQPLDKILEE
ncbi:hypothetical protein HQ545_00110 [Candidatus Woesearchaeota archaeon]|nr:hypothetical protein [Candidatus Woesearchaeota archaeon]